MTQPAILVHGGAGDVPEALRPRHREGCAAAARLAGELLEKGGSAVDAAALAVRALEDDEVFNAGTGCALTRVGSVSLDAAVMCGATLNVGAVGALGSFQNPILIARHMLEEEPLLLVGPEADAWAVRHGFEAVREDQLIVERTVAAWERVVQLGHASNWAGGTVGAVARDSKGRTAAATSTGGTMGKAPGRVGDSPLVGLGTYANADCAVSCTGTGETFIRHVFAARAADALGRGESPAEYISAALERMRAELGGEGGVILMPLEGRWVADCNTKGMAHGWWSPFDQGSAD